MRADAQKNRTRILQAAENLFAKDGTDVSTERVAELAEVGIGSVFRHFPTKELLLHAVLMKQLGELRDTARTLADAEDAGDALVTFLRRAFELARTKSTVTAALIRAGSDVNYADSEIGRDLREVLSTLMHRAQLANRVRKDITAEELIVLFTSVLRTSESLRTTKSAAEGVLNLVLDGLRTVGGSST